MPLWRRGPPDTCDVCDECDTCEECDGRDPPDPLDPPACIPITPSSTNHPATTPFTFRRAGDSVIYQSAKTTLATALYQAPRCAAMQSATE